MAPWRGMSHPDLLPRVLEAVQLTGFHKPWRTENHTPSPAEDKTTKALTQDRILQVGLSFGGPKALFSVVEMSVSTELVQG